MSRRARAARSSRRRRVAALAGLASLTLFAPLLADAAAHPASATTPAHAALSSPDAAPHPGATTPAHAARIDQDSLDVEIRSVTPAVLREGDSATILVRVTNRTAERIEGAQVELTAQGWTSNTRTTLHRWLDPDAYDPTIDLATIDLPPLSPGVTTEVRFTVPAEDFEFDTWGPRGIQVASILPTDNPTPDPTDSPTLPAPALPDRERSWVIWWNEPDVQPVPVGTLIPVTPTPEEIAGTSPWQERYTTLIAAGSAPGTTLLVDPSPFDFPTPPADTPPAEQNTPPATTTPAPADPPTTPTASPTITSLLAQAPEVWALPWAWADTEALLDAARPDLITAAHDRSLQDLTALGVTPAGSLEGTLNPTLEVVEATGGPLLLTSTHLPDWYERGTPAGLIRVHGENAVVLDQLLADIAAGTTTVDRTTYSLTASQQLQLAAATTAVTVREDPSRSRPLFFSLSPDDDAAPPPAIVALAGLPWVTPLTLSDAEELVLRPSMVPNSVLTPANDPAEGAVTAAHFEEAAAIEADFEAVARVVADSSAIATPELEQLDLLAARAWLADPSERDGRLARARDAVDGLQGTFTVITPASILMVSESSNFPVTVANALPSDATMVVSLRASDLRLQQTEPQVVEVPANGEVRADIPVTAVGSGDLTVYVSLFSVDGAPLGQGTPIEVRMRADWENTAMLGLIGLGVLSFGFGVVRTVRRNRREDRSALIEEAMEQYEAHLAQLEAARDERGRE